MKGWLKAAVDRAPPPAWVNLKRITAECIKLYCQVKPPGEITPISVEPFQVGESVPTEDNIEWAVWRLRNNFSGGPSGIRAENINVWL